MVLHLFHIQHFADVAFWHFGISFFFLLSILCVHSMLVYFVEKHVMFFLL